MVIGFPLKLELEEVISHPKWILGAQLEFPGRVASVLWSYLYRKNNIINSTLRIFIWIESF